MSLLPHSLFSSLTRLQRRVAHALYDRDGMTAMFEYARNQLTGTLVVAAGLHALRQNGDGGLPLTQWALERAGWLVLAFGLILLGFNLIDGLRRLGRRHTNVLLRLLAILLYVGVSIRLTQVFLLFQYGK